MQIDWTEFEWQNVVTVAGFRNLCGCGNEQQEHSIYRGQNVQVLAVAVDRGSSRTDVQQLRRSASTRSFTFTTKI